MSIPWNQGNQAETIKPKRLSLISWPPVVL